MGIVNRTLAADLQHENVPAHLGAVATSITRTAFVAPYPCQLKQIQVKALGLSGAPQHAVNLARFVVGAGATSIEVVAAGAIPAFGTSGLKSLTLPSSGSSLLDYQAKDTLEVVSSVANTNMTDCVYAIVVKAVEDIKTFYGTSVS